MEPPFTLSKSHKKSRFSGVSRFMRDLTSCTRHDDRQQQETCPKKAVTTTTTTPEDTSPRSPFTSPRSPYTSQTNSPKSTSRRNSLPATDSICARCGAETTFLCAYCYTVNYCSARCAREDFSRHLDACFITQIQTRSHPNANKLALVESDHTECLEITEEPSILVSLCESLLEKRIENSIVETRDQQPESGDSEDTGNDVSSDEGH